MTLILVSALLATGCPAPDPGPPLPEPTNVLDEVDVFQGSGGAGFGVGSAFPGPALPFGMVRPGPDSRGESSTIGALHCSGYRFEDPYIAGFSHLRMHGTGIPDYGSPLLVPSIGWEVSKRGEQGYRLRKDTESEQGAPGYYAVSLETVAGPVLAELTASLRGGLHRYTFPQEAGDEAGVIVDMSHVLPGVDFVGGEFSVVDSLGQELQGWMHFSGPYSERHGGDRVHYSIRFSRAPTSFHTWDGLTEEGSLGLFGIFDLESDPVVEVRVGISFVSEQNALANREAELDGQSFEAVQAAARAAWGEALSSFALGGGSDTDRAIFASSAYHALLMPTLFTDVDGRYLGFDGEVHTADGWTYYTDFSMWDTYRTLHPLLNFVDPTRQAHFLRSLYEMSLAGGEVPQWPLGSGYTGGMVGDPADIVFADALIRGIGVELVDEVDVLALLVDGALQRSRHEEYVNAGYLSDDGGSGSVSITLEYAWADGALAELAEHVGDGGLAEELRARSQSYRNLWDAETGFLRPRSSDGSFVEPFDPTFFHQAFVEGDAWQYLWMAPQDYEGLIALFGSDEAFVLKLREFFESSYWEAAGPLPSYYYWHGNEPDIHAAFLFALAGRSDLSVQWSRWVEDTKYGLGADGLAGNDDAGTLAAWYVFSSLGLFPLAGSDSYVLTAPRFPSAELRIGDGLLRIDARGLEEGATVEAITVDGEAWSSPTISWDRIREGAHLVFKLGTGS